MATIIKKDFGKYKNLKNANFSRSGDVEINGILIPIKSVNMEKNTTLDFSMDSKIFKKKQRMLTADEKKQFGNLLDKSLQDSKMSVMVIEYDMTDPEFKTEMVKSTARKEALFYLKYIDMDLEVEEGVTLWQLWEIEKGNYEAVYDKFVAMDFTPLDMLTLQQKITEIMTPSVKVTLENANEVKAEIEKITQ